MTTLSRILCVEDEEDILSITQVALEELGGYTVCPCGSGAAAIRAAAAFAPQLLLLDVMMPELDGPATLSALRAIPATATTPVVFMTAKVQRQEIEQLERLGAVGVIAKPFDPMTLPDQLRAIWQRYAK